MQYVLGVNMITKLSPIDRYGIDLEVAVSELSSGGNWPYLLELASRFRNYSSMNLLLLYSQASRRGFMPSLVAGYRSWQRLGRQVAKGEKALYIFAPNIKKPPDDCATDNVLVTDQLVGFRLVSVFDLSQTTGKDLPLLPEPKLLSSNDDELYPVVHKLCEHLRKLGFEVGFQRLYEVNGLTDFAKRKVQIRSDVSVGQKLKTLIHELGHVILHMNRVVSREQAEIEAESCAYLVCRALGVDSSSYSFPYVARWARGDCKKIAEMMDNIKNCAEHIILELGC